MFILSPLTKQGRTRWGYYDGETFKEFEPEDVPGVLLELIEIKKNQEIYIANLSKFIEDVVLTLWAGGYTPIEGNPPIKQMREKQYKYLISGDYTVYQITIFRKQRSHTLIDPNNLLRNMTPADIAEAWGTGEDELLRYITGLFQGIGRVNRESGKKKKLPLTISSAARSRWMTQFNFFALDNIIPNANAEIIETGDGEKMTLEAYCRPAYHGGLCVRNTEMKEIGPGVVLDVNSLYPYCMASFPLPYGHPEYIKGKPKQEVWQACKDGWMYIFVRVRARFKLKPGRVACISLGRDTQSLSHERGWLTSSDYYARGDGKFYDNKDGVLLTLCYTDFIQFKENYNIEALEFVDALQFRASRNMFADYVFHFYEMKRNATTLSEKAIDKMFLNALSGILAKLPKYENVGIRVDEESGTIDSWIFQSFGGASYVYIGAAITAYARRYLMTYIYKCKDRWLYSDTDSIHLKGTDIPEGFPISGEMGAFKVEHTFTNAVYYKKKMYAIEEDGAVKFTLAGVPLRSIEFLEGMFKAARAGVEFLKMQSEIEAGGLDFPRITLSDLAVQAIEEQFSTEENLTPYEARMILEEEETTKTPWGKLKALYADARAERGLLKICYDELPVFLPDTGGMFEEATTTSWITIADSLKFA